ncbi:helix-turn-helix domain-containing protein [Escherichia coli]|uniref:helix-turn-helix domain-containing protein n=2 Tax=Escherichia coli TaxID=562 RepID=UPI002035A433|nr:helix-turn-helix transcriptional regulator [Escherichia coli]
MQEVKLCINVKLIFFETEVLLMAKVISSSDLLDLEERSERIRATMAEWRGTAGMSRRKVASVLGITPAAVSQIERNAGKARVETLARYAWACGVKNPVIPL